MKLITKIFCFTAILTGLCTNAQTLSTNDKLPFDPKVIKKELDNGLTYYIRENHEPKNRAELFLVVNAGSVLEDDDQQGLAHFLEHMAFNGTKNFEKHEIINYFFFCNHK